MRYSLPPPELIFGHEHLLAMELYLFLHTFPRVPSVLDVDPAFFSYIAANPSLFPSAVSEGYQFVPPLTEYDFSGSLVKLSAVFRPPSGPFFEISEFLPPLGPPL